MRDPEDDFDVSDPEAVSFCPGCGKGYGAGPEHCAAYGEKLVSRAEIELLNPYRAPEGTGVDSLDLGPWVRLGNLESPFKADVLTMALEEAGIPFGTSPLAFWETLGRGTVRVMVRPEDQEAASRILAELDEVEQAPPEETPERGKRPPSAWRSSDARAVQTHFDLSDPDAMSFCPSCRTAFRGGFTRCSDCQEELVPRNQVEKWVAEGPTEENHS